MSEYTLDADNQAIPTPESCARSVLAHLRSLHRSWEQRVHNARDVVNTIRPVLTVSKSQEIREDLARAEQFLANISEFRKELRDAIDPLEALYPEECLPEDEAK